MDVGDKRLKENMRNILKENLLEVGVLSQQIPRVAESRDWSDAERTLLLQCVLTGKAQEAYSALSVAESKVYVSVKTAVLKAYELVPEAYRQKFRSWEKSGRQTHMEFARELVTHFNRWCTSLGVHTYEALCDLVVLEQFKNSLPSNIATFVAEHKVKTAAEAAALADEYVLTHRVDHEHRARDEFGFRGDGNRFRPVGKRWEETAGPRHTTPEKAVRSQGYYDAGKRCNYCKGRGHWKNECPAKAGSKGGPVESPGSISSRVISPCSVSLSPFPSDTQVEIAVNCSPGHRDFSAFVSDGHVSLVGSDDKVPVKILRDTGAFDSFIVSTVLPFSHCTDTGDYILMRGMGLNVLPVPVHKLELDCGLVRGEVVMGVRPALPIPGVDIILGNDLAGIRVWADGPPPPVVTSSPSVAEKPDESAQSFPSVFTACAVTRAMRSREAEPEAEQSDTEGNEAPSVSIPDSLLSVSRSDLAQEQSSDLSLRELFHMVLPGAKGKSAARGYFLQDQLLVRKWVPHGDCFVGNPVFQIVVPEKFREEVLRTAHNQSGHLGVRKTYNYILKYFFWPRLKKDVSRYIRTCHTCQLTGKPNQTVKPVPLIPIPAMTQPFEHLIIDCVGPLPRSRSGSSYLLTVMCQSTRYPAAYPLRTITAKSVVRALTQFMSIFGIPKVIQSDQGSNFSSHLFAQVLRQLRVKHNQASAYHAQSQGALERFHQTLKSLLRGYCVELDQDWEEGLPWLLLAAREVVQESTGFSPNDLVFGHRVRGPLTLLYDHVGQSEPPVNLLDFVNGFRHRLYMAGERAKKNLVSAQNKMKQLYDRRTEKTAV
uniref:Gypsy retrotransposon integrase-like protein 1 n=1 Tax=Lates calcarifer TaxID=8187 RepID=A0A4W6FVS0_LATCA